MQDIRLSTGVPHASASTAYSAWAASLGVSPTASISSFDEDDGYTQLDLGFPFMGGGSSIAFCGNGVIGLYGAPVGAFMVDYLPHQLEGGVYLPIS